MRAVDYLIKKLIQYGVSDAFGIPGGVILDLLYALKGSRQICPHLMFHEQAAGFAALGYAQTNGTLGTAYATRGPGFTNLVTAIADAYQESLPVIFITAHLQQTRDSAQRMELDQELDAVGLVRRITKYAGSIDALEDFVPMVDTACQCAVSSRQGPVLLDVYAPLWYRDVECREAAAVRKKQDMANSFTALYTFINKAKRPVILAGNGVRQSRSERSVLNLAEVCNIPILTSRCSQDLFGTSSTNFGYIGSHGLRYSNFILSKADLIIALGNRMSFPIHSASFAPLFKQAAVVQVEIDRAELVKKFPNCIQYNMDLKEFFTQLDVRCIEQRDSNWLDICRRLKHELFAWDTEYPVDLLSEIMKQLPENFIITADVGNHEFWVSRAYAHAGICHRILYSRAFGTLGNALPKSIGVYYKTRKPVLCITGDQGLQMNIQELQFISANKLPVGILLINNRSSGMIHSHEKLKYGEQFVHTTQSDGYSTPNFGAVARAYGLAYQKVTKKEDAIECVSREIGPYLLEIDVQEDTDLCLSLPKGHPCQDMAPELDRDFYQRLNSW